MTPVEYSEHRKVTRQAVHKAIGEGRIQLEGGLIDRERADREWAANSVPEASGSANASAGDDGNRRLSYAEARAYREAVRGRMLRLDLDERLGRTHDAAECDLRAAECAKLTQDRLLSLVRQISGKLHAAKSKRELELLLGTALKEEFRRIATAIEQRADEAEAEAEAGRAAAGARQ